MIPLHDAVIAEEDDDRPSGDPLAIDRLDDPAHLLVDERDHSSVPGSLRQDRLLG